MAKFGIKRKTIKTHWFFLIISLCGKLFVDYRALRKYIQSIDIKY